MKRLMQCLRFDMLAGRRFLSASGLLGCLMAAFFLAGSWVRASAYHLEWSSFTLGDNALLLLGGALPPAASDQTPILFPIGWLLLFVSSMAAPVLYAGRSSRGSFAANAIIRGGARAPWLIAKCLWSIIASLVFWLAFFTVLSGLTLCASGDLSSLASGSIEAIGLARNDDLTEGPYTLGAFLLIAPVVSTLLLVPLVLLSILVNELLAFLVGIGCLLASVMSITGFVPGEYLMATRTNSFLAHGIAPVQALAYSLTLSIVSLLIGMIVFRSKNFMGRSETHD